MKIKLIATVFVILSISSIINVVNSHTFRRYKWQYQLKAQRAEELNRDKGLASPTPFNIMCHPDGLFFSLDSLRKRYILRSLTSRIHNEQRIKSPFKVITLYINKKMPSPTSYLEVSATNPLFHCEYDVYAEVEFEDINGFLNTQIIRDDVSFSDLIGYQAFIKRTEPIKEISKLKPTREDIMELMKNVKHK